MNADVSPAVEERHVRWTTYANLDERDPDFDAYQDVQSQNDYSTAQLNVMGFRGDVLRAQFRPDKIRELKASGPVTVANTH